MNRRIQRTSTFAIFLLIVLLISGCNISDNDDEFTDRYTYTINPKSVITVDSVERPVREDSTVTVTNFSIEPGDSTVFRYRHDRIAPDNIADGDFSEILVFQIPANTNKFEITSESFGQVKALYRQSCFCQFAGSSFRVTGGTIRGEKLSAVHWIVHGDVSIKLPYGSEEISFEEPFFVE